MTRTEMLARLRTFLDEASAVLYNDTTELYPALSLAQIELAKAVADSWKERQLNSVTPVKVPITLAGVRTVESGTISSGNQTVAISGNPLQVLSVLWQFDGSIVTATPFAVECAEGAVTLSLWQNSLLSGGIFYFYRPNLLTVNPISTNASAGYTIVFYDTPADITSSVDPKLDAVSHDAIVERALWILLKDREVEQAQLHLQLYGSLLEGLMR